MTAYSGSQACEDVLARIRRELERISERQHELARRKALLRDLATQLRLGRSSTLLNVALRDATASSVIGAIERPYGRDATVEELAREMAGVGAD